MSLNRELSNGHARTRYLEQALAFRPRLPERVTEFEQSPPILLTLGELLRTGWGTTSERVSMSADNIDQEPVRATLVSVPDGGLEVAHHSRAELSDHLTDAFAKANELIDHILTQAEEEASRILAEAQPALEEVEREREDVARAREEAAREREEVAFEREQAARDQEELARTREELARDVEETTRERERLEQTVVETETVLDEARRQAHEILETAKAERDQIIADAIAGIDERVTAVEAERERLEAVRARLEAVVIGIRNEPAATQPAVAAVVDDLQARLAAPN